MKHLFLVFFYGITMLSHTLFGQVTPVAFVSGIGSVTDISNCGDERLFITEQRGRIMISDLFGNLTTRPFLNIQSKVSVGGERGLLGLAFSPYYATDGRIYVNYTNTSLNSVVARYTVSEADPDSIDINSEEILMTIIQPFNNHNGGSMQFGPDGYLYISFGDGGSGGDPLGNAQNLQSLLGKILRIDVNVPVGFRVPLDNPFFADTSALPQIWAYGLRNPWRSSFDRLNGDYWITDVGQALIEEVNRQPSGHVGGINYGWRCYEGTLPYDTTACTATNYTTPLYEYKHNPDCSVTGGYVYRGSKNQGFFGSYFFTDYCSGELKVLKPQGSNGYTFDSLGTFSPFDYTCFGEDRYGELYIGSFYNGVFRLDWNNCAVNAYLGETDTIYSDGPAAELHALEGLGNTYQWLFEGNLIPELHSPVLSVSAGGKYTVVVTNDSCGTDSATVFVIFRKSGNGVIVYQNQQTDDLNALSNAFKDRIVNYKIFDMQGKLCLNGTKSANGQGLIQIGNTHLRTGIYVISFEVTGYSLQQKFVISKIY